MRPSRFRVRQNVVPLPARVSLLCGICVITVYPDLQAIAVQRCLYHRLTLSPQLDLNLIFMPRGEPKAHEVCSEERWQHFVRSSIDTEALSRMFTSRPIGFVSSPYQDASEVPKGLGAKHEADGVLKILPEFEAGLTDIEGFSHLVVIWEFDRSHGFELLATPPSDNRSHGVFATRSPRRPNPLGLTTVELRRREGIELHVRGIDMLNGTPILDIKPYLSSIPSERLRRGWLAEAEARQK